MKRKIILASLLILLGSLCFAQGFSTPCFMLYPVESCKDSFILLNKTVNISEGFISEVVLTVKNLNQTAEGTFTYLDYSDATSFGLRADQISVYINGKQIETVSEDDMSGNRYSFTGSVPKGTFKIKYIVLHGGRDISGETYCEIFSDGIENWNVSETYSDEIHVSVYNDIFSCNFDQGGSLKLIGNGKTNGRSYFLSSGYVKYVAGNKHSNFVVWCSNFKNGCGGGSGAPTLPSIYSDDHKVHSPTNYISQFITAAKIISKELISDWNHEHYEDLINYLNISTPEELRLFRNAFYAKNGYVFKDPELNLFFNEALCYIPNKSLKLKSITMADEEKILIEMIQAAEQGNSPEEVFNKYKALYPQET